MTDRIDVSYLELDELAGWLEEIVTELKDAASRADDLETAIGDPFDNNRLREAAEEFEDQWNDRRTVLAGDLEEVQSHVQGVVDGFRDGDIELAASLEDGQTGN